MAEPSLLQSFNRPLVLRISAVLLLVGLLLWGTWVSRELARPREQIVTVRLAETIARFVDVEARAQKDPAEGQARTLAYLKAAEAAVQDMGTGGRVVLVEYRGEEQWVPIKPSHKMTEAQVRAEMALQPLEWVETLKVLPRQHILIFRRRAK